MLTVQEMATLPDDDPRKIVDRIRSQQTRAAASRRLIFDCDDAAAAEWITQIIAAARRAERERCAEVTDCGGHGKCGEWYGGPKQGYCMAHEGYCARDIAAEIRALPDTP